jgi:hypothetical protein
VREVGEGGCRSCCGEAAAEEGTTVESRFHVYSGVLCMGRGYQIWGGLATAYWEMGDGRWEMAEG